MEDVTDDIVKGIVLVRSYSAQSMLYRGYLMKIYGGAVG